MEEVRLVIQLRVIMVMVRGRLCAFGKRSQTTVNKTAGFG